MVLSNKGFARLVIAVFIIYGYTHAKKLVMVPCIFLKSFKVGEDKSCDDYVVRLGS